MTQTAMHPIRGRILATLAVCAPGLIVVLGLAAMGEIGWAPALLAVAATVAAAIAISTLHLVRLARLRRLVGRLGEPDASGSDMAAAYPNRDAGLLFGLEATLADTHERLKRQDANLRAKVADNEAVLAALPDPLLVLDGEGRVTRTNKAAQDLFGQGKEGRHLTEILRHPNLLAAADTGRQSRIGQTVEFTQPGTVERHFMARVTPLGAADDRAAVLTLHDITAIRRAERLRGDFVANASHELRTPLASLVGFIETLRGPAREDPEAQRRFLSIMDEQARRMARLIEDLLSLSRIELDEHTPPRESVDLGHVLRSVAGGLEIQARKKKMRIMLDVAGVPPVVGNEDELTQLFQNLVENAVKYGRTDTEIRIVARDVDGGGGKGAAVPDSVAVAIVDQGEGIAREDIPRLTERFYRVDKARSRALGGTGLGLAIVKHIVNRHRGRLTIDSTPGKGSTFTVQLPTPKGLRSGPARSLRASA